MPRYWVACEMEVEAVDAFEASKMFKAELPHFLPDDVMVGDEKAEMFDEALRKAGYKEVPLFDTTGDGGPD